MRWARSNTIRFAACALAVALVSSACFGGSEGGETEVIASPVEGEVDGPDSGGGSGENGAGGTDGSGESEQALLEIISDAEGSEANPDNRTGAPSTTPALSCLPRSENDFTVSQLNLPTAWGRDLGLLACIRDADLMLVTVTDPGGELHQQFWTEGLFHIDISPLDLPGSYEIAGQRRQGDDVVTAFEVPPLNELHIVPVRAGDGLIELQIGGYGDQRSLRIAVYGRSTEGGVPNQLAYVGSLDQITLEDDGSTAAPLATTEDFLCFYVDAADEDRFPSYQPGCLKPESVPYQPSALDLAVRLSETLGEPGLQAIGPVVASVDTDRRIAITTVVDEATEEPMGAALFEGRDGPTGAEFESIRLVERDTDQDFAAAFSRLCAAAADAHPVIGDPCLRNVERPELIEFEGFEPIEIDVPSLTKVTDQAVITDCLRYDPGQVTVIDEGADGFVLTDGRNRMAVLDTKSDAQVALTVAQYHDRQCFVGRDNGRADRDAYLGDFWLGGKPGGPTLPNEDCVRYDPARLKIVDIGERGWQLSDGRSSMLLLDTEEDAKQALNTAAGFTRQCFAGRNNTRAERSTYIFEYWK